MYIKHILEEKGREVVTVRPAHAIPDVLAQLAKNNIGAVIVSKDGMRVEGIISERDIIRRLVEHGPDLLSKRVQDISLHKVYTCTPEDDIYTVMTMMRRRRIRHMPVVVGGTLCGIVSLVDILRQHLAKADIA